MQKKKRLNTVFRPPILLVVVRGYVPIVPMELPLTNAEYRKGFAERRGERVLWVIFLVAICLESFFFFCCSYQFIVLTSAFFQCGIFIQPLEKVKGFLGRGCCMFVYTCLIVLSNKIMSSVQSG